ncbi:MAG: hypothetical protein REI12_11140, partial [Pedobacter sp.]|nr:hypothetical protein [Pedobacter sp.]
MPLLESTLEQPTLVNAPRTNARSALASSLSARVALSFLLLSLLTRMALLALSLPVAGGHPGNWIAAFLVGSISDLATLAFALLPVALFELLLPPSWPRASALLRGGAFAFITFTLLFTAASEVIFWQEFGSRFNFIAVDYLVYTREVLDNIRQSYPVGPLLALFAAMALVPAFFWRQHWRDANRISRRQRATIVLALMVAGCLSWSLWNSERPAVTRNHYANELAGNGIYNFFSAYRNNELNYSSYYPTLPAAELGSQLQ